MGENENKQTGGDDKIQTLRTFESDAAEYIKKTGQSRASIVLAQSEQKDKSEAEFKFVEKTVDIEKVKFILTIAGILLLAGILIFLVFVFFKPLDRPAPPSALGQPIVLIDDQKVLDVTSLQNEQVMEKIAGALEGSTVGANSILLLRLTKVVGEETLFLTAEEFFGFTTRFAPDQLIRSLEKTFAFGILGWSGNQPFLIFKTDSFENTSSGMTEWERTMPMELKTLFETENGWAETTPAFGPGSTSQSQFGNTVVSNLDARQLTNSAGATVLIYSFPDKNTLIITTNEQTFSALVTKLRNAKLVR